MEINAFNAPRMYTESLWRMRTHFVEQNSRNGPVRRVPEPVIMTIMKPEERMIFCNIRQANPFFHVMEFVWMMAGSRDVRWIEQFNARYRAYANGDVVHGAYGYRWRDHFGIDQILTAVDMLKKDPEDRRVVLGMWDPSHDLARPDVRDVPCNTHIYLDGATNNHLEMVVCNRSNDLIWGAMGANVVHMTMLQELMARAAGYKVGKYRVFTKNLHIYTGMPRFEEIWNTFGHNDDYEDKELNPYPLLHGDETLQDFLDDASDFVSFPSVDPFNTQWFNEVALPMRSAYLARKAGTSYSQHIDNIKAQDMQLACNLWVEWKNDAKHNS